MKTLLTACRGNSGATGTTTAGATQYWWLGQATLVPNGTEINRNIPFRAGTLSKLYVRVIANTTSLDSTVTVRKNGADTALTVTITAGTAEVKENPGSITVTEGDLLCYKTVSGGTGTLTLAIISVVFDATTNCVSKLVTQGYTLSADSTTQFLPVAGNRSGTTTNEANVEATVKIACVAKNAAVYVGANARITDTTFTLRKNRVDAIVITFTAGETGLKEDTSSTVSVAVDDELSWESTTSTGGGNLTFQAETVDIETLSNGFVTAGCVGASSDITIAPSVTSYFVIGGSMIEDTTTEADAQMTAREAFTLSNLTVYTNSNTITADTTIRIRKNGANGNQLITIEASGTGFRADTSNTDTFVAGDLIDYQIITGGTGTSISIRQLAVTMSAPAAAATVTTMTFLS